MNAVGIRVPGVPMGDAFMASPPKARQLLFHDPASAVAMTILPDAAPPERLETVLRGREAAARLLWNPAQAYRKLTSRLWRIQAPALVVWGAHDRLAPLQCAEAWRKEIPGATLRVFDDSGHVPHIEEPDAVAAAVAEFCASREATR